MYLIKIQGLKAEIGRQSDHYYLNALVVEMLSRETA